MRRSHLACYVFVLAALWVIKLYFPRHPIDPPSKDPPPRASVPFRAGSAREWLSESPGQLNHAILRKDGIQ